MSHNACAAPSPVAASPASSPTLRALLTCLIFLLLSHLPAYADHIHHLRYNNSTWHDQDLTLLTGGGIATPFGAIAAFYTTPNRQLHVYFVDSNVQHVHQLYNNGTSWSDSDLTASTGGPTASAYGITGFSIGNLQYVFYQGSDSHVHELNYNNVNWTDQDLTALVGRTLAGGGPILAFATKPNNQFHVYYQDSSSLHLHQLYFNGTSWSDSDLTSIIGGAYCYTSWIAGFAVGNLQHVFCPGFGKYSNNLDMLHIYYNNSTWVYEDVTFQAGGSQTPMNLGSGVAAFKVPNANQFEVFGITDDTHFNRYYHVVKPAQWIDQDLTNNIGAPSDGQFGGIVAFPTTPNNQYHMYYAPSTEVYQIYYNGLAWSIEDLTGGAGQADDNSGMAGFSIGNLQHVFYMSFGN
jgi:Fungal fucose-specific lectin